MNTKTLIIGAMTLLPAAPALGWQGEVTIETPNTQLLLTAWEGGDLRQSYYGEKSATLQQLRDAGYSAQIVKNESNNMFRVVAATFDSKNDAVSSRNAIRGSQFNEKGDAWLLYNQQ